MKISKREQTMILVLIALAVLVGYYKFIYVQQRANIEKQVSERDAYKTKYDNVQSLIASVEKKNSDIKILNSKIMDKTARLYPSIEQEKIILELDELLTKSGLKGTINFSDIAVQAIDEDKKAETKTPVTSQMQQTANQYNALKENGTPIANNTTNNKVNGNAATKSQDPIEQMKVTLSLQGSYDNVAKFIKNLEDNKKKMIVSGMTMTSAAANEVSCSMILELYAVPKVTDEDAEYMKWSLNNSYGKVNPFEGGGAQTLKATIEDSSKPKEEMYDFIMSARPINSDLPTVMLGKAKDSERKTYIYADNEKEEKVEIYFTEKEGKCYYKYKTSKNGYPSNLDGDGVEFSPLTNTVTLKIYSNKRLSDQDNSSANVKIYNKTSKSVYVIVEGDDVTRPRVSVTGDGGNVDIKRN